MSQRPKKIAIVGGGITGLAAAYRCRRLDPQCKIKLFEAADRLGGVLQTERVDGYLIEQSGDMFTIDPPAAMELCRELGKLDELIETRNVRHRAFVATPTGIEPVPAGFSLMLPTRLDTIRDSRLFDEAGRFRLLDEANIPPRWEDGDESLESFAVRRFGPQAFARLIQPLVSGIYTADPRKLSMRATMNRFLIMEREHGSLIAAANANKDQDEAVAESAASGARYSLFRAPRSGMGAWVDWLAAHLKDGEIKINCQITSLTSIEEGWQVRDQQFDGVIMACSSRAAGQLLKHQPELALELAAIEAASTAIVVLGLDLTQVSEKFAGFGIVIPNYLGRKAIAFSFLSNKFAGRAPDGKLLVRCFIGGALQGELVDESDSQLIGIALGELDQLVGLTGQPELARVYRWKNCMPQYHLGHLDRVARIEQLSAQIPRLELAGNSYRGVGIPVCVASGIQSAERLMTQWSTDETRN